MIVKAKEIEVVAGNPFQNDKLSRKENAEILTEFVCSSSEPMVVCIDAPWGCSGQLKLATVLEFSQYKRSDSLGVNPPLY